MTRREALAGALLGSSLRAAGDGEWMPLFDAKALNGWEGDPRVRTVENGAIVGTTDTDKVDQSTFFIHRDPVADFHLMVEVKLRNHNSGIQFRSQCVEDPGWIVAGYQTDFSDAGDNSAWGLPS
jgi:hypothetical protein